MLGKSQDRSLSLWAQCGSQFWWCCCTYFATNALLLPTVKMLVLHLPPTTCNTRNRAAGTALGVVKPVKKKTKKTRSYRPEKTTTKPAATLGKHKGCTRYSGLLKIASKKSSNQPRCDSKQTKKRPLCAIKLRYLLLSWNALYPPPPSRPPLLPPPPACVCPPPLKKSYKRIPSSGCAPSANRARAARCVLPLRVLPPVPFNQHRHTIKHTIPKRTRLNINAIPVTVQLPLPCVGRRKTGPVIEASLRNAGDG